ncbi:MAG: hypothetical protein ACH346_01770 [Chthoniobacterales bacterium]
MIPPTLSLAQHALTPPSKAILPNTPSLDAVNNTNTPGITSLTGNALVNHHTPSHNGVSADTEAFYAMGPDAIPPGPPPVNLSPSMSLDSANIFEDLPRYLQGIGGPSDATAMLGAQIQVEQATLGWTLIGQMASKAVSGIQTLFNNQV